MVLAEDVGDVRDKAGDGGRVRDRDGGSKQVEIVVHVHRVDERRRRERAIIGPELLRP